MKFAMSYSCGKDSTMALHQMIEDGHRPVCLVVMINKAAGRSYFHGADAALLDKYEQALGLPMIRCDTDGAGYHLALEAGLRRAREMGAQAAAFGDIDIDGNRGWEQARCAAVGLTPVFPLWQTGREENVRRLIRLGYQCIVKSINNTLLPESLLGQTLDETVLAVMQRAGIDLCGENGEYHTLTVGGPVFRSRVPVRCGGLHRFGDYSVIEID